MQNFKTDFEKSLKESNLSEKEIAFKNLNAKEFSKQGFPNRRDEDWKFSDINQIIKKEIGELNQKESPRLEWAKTILNKMGIKTVTTNNSIKIYGNPSLNLKKKIPQQ